MSKTLSQPSPDPIPMKPGAGPPEEPARWRFRAWWPAILALAVLLPCPRSSIAQNQPPVSHVLKGAPPGAFDRSAVQSIEPLERGAEIESVYVEGLVRVDSSLVLRKFGVRPGKPFLMEAVRQGLHALYALGYFSDLQVSADTLDDGKLALLLEVEERPTVGGVDFVGNKHVDSSKLKTAQSLNPGDWVDEEGLVSETAKLREYYRGEGYAGARVNAKLVPPGSRTPAVVYDIEEGDKVKILAIQFAGNSHFEDKQLRKEMEAKPKGFLRGGTYKPDEVNEDASRIATFYRDHGYRDAVVHVPTITYDSTGRNITAEYKVDEGARYRFGITRYAGSSLLPDSALARFVTYKTDDVYSEAQIRKSLEGLYQAFQERGYIFVNVDPQMGVRDTTVDLQYAITEGKIAHLHEIHVTGNTHTKEKVIRRELSMRQGDVFRRSGLQRSQRDVFALGLFSDVGIDYKPLPEPNPNGDVDLTFKIAEKQTGTASMGAGYSSSTGLTGFADLGHKNIFGGGQSANLHLERGNQLSNYEVSYNEPYFKDTPTSVGFDIYNTFRNRNSTSLTSVTTRYDQRRRGGAVTIGRPLSFLDYSRISVSYRLEDVSLENFLFDSVSVCDIHDTLTGGKDTCIASHRTKSPGQEDLQYLADQKYPQRTSTISTLFSRNSTNNPFYPTEGSALTYRLGVTGGPLGGAVSFNKNVLDWRHYVHAFGPFTFMHRHRLGVLAGNHNGDQVPLYERFRLGGTTEDYLRGYPDYYVVPDLARPETGGKWMTSNSFELQFLAVDPVHGVVFFDAGNSWGSWHDLERNPLKLRTSVGAGVRLEIPFLGPVGFDYAYGFDYIKNGKRGAWVPHILFGGQF